MMTEKNSDAIAKLKAVMLKVKTVGEMHALIVDYSYVEIEEAYQRLTPQQQARLNAIFEEERKRQTPATNKTKNKENSAQAIPLSEVSITRMNWQAK